MPRKILATVVETWCYKCGKPINIRMEQGESVHKVACWNCDEQITAQNGYGERNVRVTCNKQRMRFVIIWQEKV